MKIDDRPRGRSADLVVQELGGEVLIYDLRDHRALCLNETSAAVWRACDGETPVTRIAEQLGNEEAAWLAIDQLRMERLLDNDAGSHQQFDSMPRREMIRRAALGSAIALPLIAAIVAPTAVNAQSCLPTDAACTQSAQCCSNCCKNVGGGVNQCKPGGGACLP